MDFHYPMRKRSKIALVIPTALIIGLLALQTPLLHRLRGLAWQVWLQGVTYAWPVGTIAIKNDVMTQLQHLTSENVRLRSELKDYQRLREQLGSPAFTSYRSVPAEVAARPLDTFGVSFVINKGARDGVSLGAPVVVYSSTLIGFVKQLHETSAIVELLLHPSTNVAVEIVSESSPQGLLVGRHYTSLGVTTIPRDAAMATGQEVVTVAREGLPPGLRVGTVSVIIRAEDHAYQEATLAVPYDPDSLRAVQVIVES